MFPYIFSIPPKRFIILFIKLTCFLNILRKFNTIYVSCLLVLKFHFWNYDVLFPHNIRYSPNKSGGFFQSKKKDIFSYLYGKSLLDNIRRLPSSSNIMTMTLKFLFSSALTLVRWSFLLFRNESATLSYYCVFTR